MSSPPEKTRPIESADLDEVKSHNLLVGVCGSSNILNIANYIFALRSMGLRIFIKAVMTRTAAMLMPPGSLRLICEEVYCDGLDGPAVSHVQLANWSDQFIVLPATANILSQAAHGLASGLLTSTLLAFPRSVTFFPCMNKAMWNQPSIRRSVALLRSDGHIVVEPEPATAWIVGSQQMEVGMGLPQPSAVAAQVGLSFAPRIARRGLKLP